MKFITTLSSVLLTCGLAFGAQVDTSKSEVTWEGGKITGSKHYGKMPIKSSKLNMDKKKKRVVSGEVVFDVTAFTVEDLKGKDAKKFLGHMKSADFFNADKWPTAKLEITEMNKGKGKGLLTIKDRKQKIDFDYKYKKGAYVGDLVFDRTQFGMIYGSGSFFKNLGDKVIKDEVKIGFKIVPKS